MNSIPRSYLLTVFIIINASLTSATSAKLENEFPESTISYPAFNNIYVNDNAGILDAELEHSLSKYLQDAGNDHGPQITLLTIQSISDYGVKPVIEPFATNLFNHWGIGDATTHDGVLILISVYDRVMRIELGAGYSTDQDNAMQAIIDDIFVPYFKKGNYSTGIKFGTIETIRKITGKYPKEFEGNLFAKTKFRTLVWLNRFGTQLGVWVMVMIAPAVILFFIVLRAFLRYRPRSCGNCQKGMTRLSEVLDDEHLSGGQKLEEYLESVDYDVWQCEACMQIDIYPIPSVFTSKSVCESCGYKTLTAETTIINHATTLSEGSKRIDYHCQNCGYEDSEIRTILKKRQESRPRSNIGRSSRRFGGGSSSGGGASGRW